MTFEDFSKDRFPLVLPDLTWPLAAEASARTHAVAKVTVGARTGHGFTQQDAVSARPRQPDVARTNALFSG